MIHSILAAFAAFLLVGAATASEIQRIDIAFRGASLGPERRDSIVISIDANGTYTMQGESTEAFPLGTPPNRRTRHKPSPVAGATLDAFERSIRAEPWSRKQFVAYLITPQWLQQNAPAVFSDKVCSREAERLFRARYSDPKNAAKALNDYYDTDWTDDWPLATVTTTFKDGRKSTLKSGAQHDAMLPWGGDRRENWNIEISRALASLLPEQAYLRERLSDINLAREVADGVRAPIRDTLEDLEMRCAHRDVLPLIESRFRILSLYGSTSNVTGYIQRADMPQNFAVNLALKKSTPEQKRAEVREFLQKIDHYIDISLPFVRTHPGTKFTVWYADGQSFGNYEVSMGPDDPKLKPIVVTIAKQCALLREHDFWNGRTWVVLPNGQVHLWRDRPSHDSKRPGSGW